MISPARVFVNTGEINQTKITRSSAVADRSRDALCHWIFQSRSFRMLPFESFGTVSYSHTIIYNYGSVLYHSEIKRDIGENCDFSYPCFRRPGWWGGRGVPVEISSYCLVQKNYKWCVKTVWLPDGEESLMRCSVVSIEHWCVTDRRTKRQTPCDSVFRAIHTATGPV